jgi:hypothetical protein
MITKVIPQEIIQNKIFTIRDKKIMFDKDLATLYGVETKALNQAVKRNIERFPADFMFQLTREEAASLRSRFVTLKRGQHLKYAPYAFTEHGILMLSSVLNSKRAVQVNIQIMRVFTKLRTMMTVHQDLKKKINGMERKYDHQFKAVFEAIRQLMAPEPDKKKVPIGFRAAKTQDVSTSDVGRFSRRMRGVLKRDERRRTKNERG